MANKWTETQKQVLDSKGSVLVSASAGTGKTAVLTEKVSKSIIDDNIDITNILIMTFSNDAAQEMKDRIRGRLEEILNSSTSLSSLQKTRLEMQIRKFDDANIQTIHSFCNDIIKKYFYKLGLDANVQIADSFDMAILKKKALYNILLPEYNNKDELFVALEDYIMGLETLEDVILRSYSKLMTITNPFEWLVSSIQNYNISLDDIPSYVVDKIETDMAKAIDFLNIAMQEYKNADGSPISKEFTQLSYEKNCLEKIISMLHSGDLNAITETTFDNFGVTLRFGKEFVIAKNYRDNARDIITYYKKSKFSIKDQLQRISDMYPISQKFTELLYQFDIEYKRLKKEKNIIDFNDMEHFAKNVLEDDQIARDYQSVFVKVFVDEYQDTSPIQEEIIKRISRKDNLFCVGDLKQSIYRFRSSDPILFSNRSAEYTLKNSGSVIPLNKNFRSAKNVLDCANDVFEHICRFSKEIEYSANDTLVHGRMDNNNLEPVIVNLIKDTIKDDLNLSNDEVEAYNIVKFINDNLGRPVFDNKLNTTRPAEYSDFVILCRKLSGLSDVLYRIFLKCNIPFFMDKTGELLDTLEVKILMNIFSLIYSRGTDIDYMTIIHMGLFDFNDEDLVAVRTYSKENSFTQNIYDCAKGNTSYGLKCNDLLSKISLYKDLAKEYSLSKLVNFILNDINYLDYLAIMENGKQRVLNIKLFLHYLNNYSLKNHGTLYDFTNYLKNVATSNERVEEANIGLAGNSVKITTIHKSKGLEYPIVILPFMSKQFNQMDQKSSILIDKDAGVGFKYFNNNQRERGKNLYRSYIENIVSQKSIEEEMRLLYVAMTRAKELLYIQGVLQYNSSWDSLLEPKNMFDWILSTLTQSSYIIPEDGEMENESSIVLNGSWTLKASKESDIDSIIANNNQENDITSFLNSFNLKNTQNSNVNFDNTYYEPIKKSASELHKTEITVNDMKKIINTSVASEKGTATHTFFKFYNFKDDVDVALNEMVSNKLITKKELSLINVDSIKSLMSINEDMFEDIANSSYVEKECSIYYLDETDTLINCVVDLLYKSSTDDQYYIVDYKTDKIKNAKESINERKEYHRPQLEIYKKAVEEIFDIKVSAINIVFTEIGEVATLL